MWRKRRNGKTDEIKKICISHGAVLAEDVAEFFGATYKGEQTVNFGTVSIISFNGNKIITGSSHGILLTNDEEAAKKSGNGLLNQANRHHDISMRSWYKIIG